MIDVAANPSDAVEKALDLFGNDILRLAYSYMKSREDAEDIVQEVLIRLMQSAGVFEDESHEKAWLLKVASNLCKDKLKSASDRGRWQYRKGTMWQMRSRSKKRRKRYFANHITTA